MLRKDRTTTETRVANGNYTVGAGPTWATGKHNNEVNPIKHPAWRAMSRLRHRRKG